MNNLYALEDIPSIFEKLRSHNLLQQSDIWLAADLNPSEVEKNLADLISCLETLKNLSYLAYHLNNLKTENGEIYSDSYEFNQLINELKNDGKELIHYSEEKKKLNDISNIIYKMSEAIIFLKESHDNGLLDIPIQTRLEQRSNDIIKYKNNKEAIERWLHSELKADYPLAHSGMLNFKFTHYKSKVEQYKNPGTGLNKQIEKALDISFSMPSEKLINDNDLHVVIHNIVKNFKRIGIIAVGAGLNTKDVVTKNKILAIAINISNEFDGLSNRTSNERLTETERKDCRGICSRLDDYLKVVEKLLK